MSEQTSRTAAALVIAVLDGDDDGAGMLFTGDDITVQYAAQVAADLARWVVESLAPEVTRVEFREGLAAALRRIPA